MRFMQLYLPWFFVVAILGLQSFNTEAKPIEVTVVTPEPFSKAALTLTGTVQAIQNTQLASQQSGAVASIFVEAGDRVTKGQLLLALDDTLAKLQIAQANAEKNIAEVAVQEAQRLHKELKALSKRQFVAQTFLAERQANIIRADAELKNAKAKLALQQELLNRHHIKAPFDGVIIERSVDVGEWIGTQNNTFDLISHDQLRIELAVPQQYFIQFSQANSIVASIQMNDRNNSEINTQVERIIAAIDDSHRTFKVFVAVPKDSGLLVGSAVSVAMNLSNALDKRVWLPKSALKQHPDGGSSVFAVIDNKATRVFVEVLEQQESKVVVKGAPSEYQYISSGVELLNTDTPVTVRRVEG